MDNEMNSTFIRKRMSASPYIELIIKKTDKEQKYYKSGVTN